MARRKKEMNAFDLMAVEQELQCLVDGNFDKAYQPSRDEVLLRFRSPSRGKVEVIIGLGKYVFITERGRENPVHPPQFSKQLRKFLSGGKVLAVRQHDFDRVLVFEIGKADGTYQLVVEVFHNGNVVLVKDGEIVQPLIHTEWSSRVIRPGREWHFPPMQFNPKTATEPKFIERVRESDTDLIRTLASLANLGPLYAEEACLQAGVDKELAIEKATSEDLARVASTTHRLIRQVRDEPAPVAYLDDQRQRIDCSPVPLKAREGLDHEPVDSISAALDDVFAPAVRKAGKKDARLEKLEQMRGRLERQVQDIGERIEAFEQEEEAERRAGDLLYAHFADVDELLKTAQDMHAEGGWGALFGETPQVGRVSIARLAPENGSLVLGLPDAEGTLHEVPVELKKSLGANAEVHYERSKEVRDKQGGARRALAKARQELAELEERGEALLEEIEQAKAAPKPTHRFWFDKYRWFVTSTGNLVIGGRDAGSNERVVKRHMEDGDRYLHAEVQGAPSIVVKPFEDQVPEQALEEASQFAVAYSKAWSQQLGRAQAYWVKPPQVSQTPESGEYVPRGSFIIRGERNYIQAPTRCGIGETHVQGHRKVMGGPIDAIKARCDRYLLMEPGQTNTGDLASFLSEVFDVPVEEVQAALPPGPVRVLESRGINEDSLAKVVVP